MKVENLRSLIRENIHSYLKEIDEAAKIGAIKASIAKCEEAIGVREKKMNMEGLDEAYHDMLDKGKMAELKSEIKALSRSLEKYKKQLAKFEKVDEVITDEAVNDEVTEEAPIATEDVMAEMGTEEVAEETAINESFLKMQKLAGVITEAEYNQKKRLIENQLSPKEQEIVDYILGENIEEGASEILSKLKIIAKKGALTLGIVSALLAAAPADAKPNIINYVKTEVPSIDINKLNQTGETGTTKGDPIAILKTSLSKTGYKTGAFPGGSSLNWGAHAKAGYTTGLSVSYESGKSEIDINITHVDGKSNSGYNTVVAAAKKLGGKVVNSNENLTLIRVPKDKVNDVQSFVTNNLNNLNK